MTLPSLKSNLLHPFTHGFFLRQGGLSTGTFESLNCDLKSLDEKSIILENRKLVAKDLGISLNNLITLNQTHSSKVITVKGPINSNITDGDAMVTLKEGIGLAVLTADCAPILFAEHETRIVGVAHVGWRGALDSIVENTVKEMIELGAKRQSISAIIGPCIQQENYEVGSEFLNKFLAENPKNKEYFVIDNRGKIWFDLPSLVLGKLTSMGITLTKNIAKCTFELSNDFYSHRRNKKNKLQDCGRMISAITI